MTVPVFAIGDWGWHPPTACDRAEVGCDPHLCGRTRPGWSSERQAVDDPVRQPHMFAYGISEILERAAPLFELMRMAAKTESEIAELL